MQTSSTSCELVEVTTALACASGDPGLVVQLKTGISRFFADLSKPPYKAIFNQSLSGAKAFNAVVLQREIDVWIEATKKGMAKKSGPEWGVLVHGNRVLSAAAFTRYAQSLIQPISNFNVKSLTPPLSATCSDVLGKLVATVKKRYSNKFLAVLFKNPSMTKVIYNSAL
jgi:hypothetical protein